MEHNTPQIDAFVGDFVNAWGRMLALEDNIDNDVLALGGDYFSLLCFATRLGYASTVLTAGEAPDGSLDPTDVMMFMKNTGALTSPCVQTCPHIHITLTRKQ